MNRESESESTPDNGCNHENERPLSLTPLPGNRPAPWSFLADPAPSLGLVAIGAAPAGPVAADAAGCYRRWLEGGLHGGLRYAGRNLEERLDPGRPRILAGATAVISLALPYGAGAVHDGIWRHVAAHARGADYHRSVRDALGIIERAVRRRFPDARARRLVDTAPVMERWWAAACGLGFIGRHGGLVVQGHGARVVLGELIVAGVPAPAAGAAMERFAGCGDCRACLDACPTGALVEPGLVDCRLCLSFHSIENASGPIPLAVAREMTALFGCDICTASCPLETDGPCALPPPPCPGPPDLDPAGLAAMPDDAVAELARGTPLERAGARALRRNAKLVAGIDHPCRPPGFLG